MMAYPGQTRTPLGQLCAALWDSQSRLNVTQPGFEPGTLVTPLEMHALNHCATREPKIIACRNPGSNQGPLDLQSNALPTELFRLVVRTLIKLCP